MWGADATQLQMGSGQPFTIKFSFFFLKNTLPPALKWERCQAQRSIQKGQNTDLIRPRTATEPDLAAVGGEVLLCNAARNWRPTAAPWPKRHQMGGRRNGGSLQESLYPTKQGSNKVSSSVLALYQNSPRVQIMKE